MFRMRKYAMTAQNVIECSQCDTYDRMITSLWAVRLTYVLNPWRFALHHQPDGNERVSKEHGKFFLGKRLRLGKCVGSTLVWTFTTTLENEWVGGDLAQKWPRPTQCSSCH